MESSSCNCTGSVPALQCLKYFSLYIEILPTFNLDFIRLNLLAGKGAVGKVYSHLSCTKSHSECVLVASMCVRVKGHSSDSGNPSVLTVKVDILHFVCFCGYSRRSWERLH